MWGAIFAAAIAIGAAVQRSRREQLRLLARRLEGGRARVPSGWFESIDRAVVEGAVGEHGVRLTFRTVGSGKHKRTYAVFRVHVRDGAGRITVRPTDPLTRFARWVGLSSGGSTGDAVLDRRFDVRGERRLVSRLGERGQGATMAAAMARAIDQHRLTAIELHPMKVESECIAPWTADAMERVILSLVELARMWSRKPLEVKVKGVAVEAPHMAWTGGSSRALCPYCRSELRQDEAEELAACGRCDTLHHAACLEEAGGCTVFGCGTRRPMRQRGLAGA